MNDKWLKVGIVVLFVALAAYLYSQNGDDSGLEISEDGDSTDSTSYDDGSGYMTNQNSVTTIWAGAIQKFEGYFPGSRSYRDNNPGNLEVNGTAGTDGAYGKFLTFADGEAALLSDLGAKIAKYPSATLLQIMNRYAPSSDHNNPAQYAQYVADELSAALGQVVTPSTTMSQLGALGAS